MTVMFRPWATIGRVSAARAVFTVQLEDGPFSISTVVVGQSADPAVPATVPVLAGHDTAFTPVNTAIRIPALNYDSSRDGKQLYVSFVWTCGNLEACIFDGASCVNAAGNPALPYPYAVADFMPAPGFSGATSFAYSVSEEGCPGQRAAGGKALCTMRPSL
jgi:hypothetical protein